MSIARRILFWAAFLLLAVVAAMALVPGIIAPADPLQTDVRAALQAPDKVSAIVQKLRHGPAQHAAGAGDQHLSLVSSSR